MTEPQQVVQEEAAVPRTISPLRGETVKRSKPPPNADSLAGCKRALEALHRVPPMRRHPRPRPTLPVVLYKGNGMRPKSMPKSCVKKCGPFGYMEIPRCALPFAVRVL